MTPAELIAWAKLRDEEANDLAAEIADDPDWASYTLQCLKRELSDLRLAARLARFAAERGGLEEEHDELA